MKKVAVLVSGILLLAAAAIAQTAPATEKSTPIASQKVLMGSPAATDAIFVLTEMDGLGKVVKDAPYTATAVTETTQTLGDGNRIVNKTTTFLARDSQGRLRREENIAKVGNLPASASKVIMIQDPVGDMEYLVQPESGPSDEAGAAVRISPGAKKSLAQAAAGTKVTAFELFQSGTTGKMSLGGPNERGTKTWIEDVRRVKGGRFNSLQATDDAEDTTNVKHESLGVQVIEGVPAEGVRDTRTIPAGAIGNERPIDITSEVWTSTELQVVVLSKRNDPRFGETVYKLTDIARGEPDPSLFQPPSSGKRVIPAK